jgi:hypothetical protein
MVMVNLFTTGDSGVNTTTITAKTGTQFVTACRILTAEIHYMWWVGRDLITVAIYRLVLLKQTEKKYTWLQLNTHNNTIAHSLVVTGTSLNLKGWSKRKFPSTITTHFALRNVAEFGGPNLTVMSLPKHEASGNCIWNHGVKVLENLTVAQLVNKFPLPFMNSEGSLPFSMIHNRALNRHGN